MKKDSFTFSDKLKKSKTLPLSKRIPSRVGGEVKAKRTFFERAQRDLPFIIVAALALLLLPFLSRESGDIDTPSVVWGDGSDVYVEDFNQPKSTEGELAFSSYRNPLDLIIKPGDKEASAKDTIDTYGEEGTSSSTSSDYSRSSYGEEDYSSAPATSKYGKTVKRSIRNSINRVPTAIGSLRAGSMVSPGSGSGVGHSLAFGSRSKSAAPKVQGTGVRPVALQPLTAAGKGRDLTGGDALYAEAARSIGAFNKPGAKQALMEAQLKDVDGKPLGETKAAGAAAAAGKPGAGGGPSNSWGHQAIKPWWWDMMNKRAQMRWELWHYNWEKMASDSLIKLTAGLASCLITGSNDFAVNKFLGEAGSSKNIPCCTAPGGAKFCADDVEDFSTSTSVSGKDKKEDNYAVHALKEMCGENAVWSVKQDISARKSALDVRLRCLGLKLSELKYMTETSYQVDCVGVNSTPMTMSVNVTRNGKTKTKKLEKMGYYVVAEKKKTGPMTANTQQSHLDQCATDRVIHIDRIPVGGRIVIDNDILLKEYPDYTIKKVVVYKVNKKSRNSDKGLSQATEEYNKMLTYTSEQQKKYNKKHGKNAYELKLGQLEEELAKQTDLYSGRTLKNAKPEDIVLTDDLKTIDDPGYFTNQEKEFVTISEEEYESDFALIRGRVKNKECVTEDFIRYRFKPWKGNLEKVHVCPVAPKLLDVEIEDGRIGRAKCFGDYKAKQLVAGEEYTFQADVIEPTRRVLAFVLERYNSQQGYEDWKLVKTFDTQSKDIKLNNEDFLYHQDGSNTYTGKVKVGVNGGKNSEVGQDAIPGQGKIVWIATEDTTGKAKSFVKASSIDASDLFSSKEPRQIGVCEYSWGCEKIKGQDICSPMDGCCKAEDGLYYTAKWVQGLPFKTTEQCSDDYKGKLLCSKLCKFQAGYYGLLDEEGKLQPAISFTQDQLTDVDIPSDCPVCNSGNVDEKVATGLTSMICIDENNIPCPCIELTNNQKPGINPLYIKSGIEEYEPGDYTHQTTPICAKKAIALGNIYVRDSNNNPIEQVQPDEDIVNMLLTKKEDERQTLCPFCRGFEPDGLSTPDDDSNLEPRASCPLKPVKIKENGPCSVIIPGETFFANAWYEICEASLLEKDLEWVYDYMKDCKDIKIEGHASKTMEAGDEPPYNYEQAKERNNIRLGFDRAVEVSKKLRTTWEKHGERVSIDLSDKDVEKYDNSVDPSNLGAIGDTNYTGSVSKKKNYGLPKSRATISQPTKANPTAIFKIVSYGSSQNTTGPRPKPYSQMTASERNEWLEKEKVDRKVVLRGTPISN